MASSANFAALRRSIFFGWSSDLGAGLNGITCVLSEENKALKPWREYRLSQPPVGSRRKALVSAFPDFFKPECESSRELVTNSLHRNITVSSFQVIDNVAADD